MSPKRSRLRPEERRAQLIAIGKRLATRESWEGVLVDEVAAEAGVSRGLLFHHFRDRRHFLEEVAQSAIDELLEASQIDPTLPPREALHAALEATIDHVEARREVHLALVRGSAGGSAAMRSSYQKVHEEAANKVIAMLGVPVETLPALTTSALRAWSAFNEEAIASWIADRQGTREELVRLMERTLVGVLATLGIDTSALEAPAPAKPSKRGR